MTKPKVMSMHWIPFVIISTCCLVFSGSVVWAEAAAGQEQPKQATVEQIKKWIQGLNAEEGEDREIAEEKLKKAGATALPFLKEAMNSEILEIAVRARKLVQRANLNPAKTQKTYSVIAPENAVFFAEMPNVKKTIGRWSASPLGRLWQSRGIKEWFQKAFADMDDEDQQKINAYQRIKLLVSGKISALLYASDLEDLDFDPPLTFVVESKENPGKMEAWIRQFWEACNDESDEPHRYGNFNMEEHFSAFSVYQQDRYIYSTCRSSMESFLDLLQDPPEKNFSLDFQNSLKLLPESDLAFSLTREGLDPLVEEDVLDNFDINSDHMKILDALGWKKGSRVNGSLKLENKTVREKYKITVPGKTGLLPLLRGAEPAAAAPAGVDALQMVPKYAAILVSFRLDFSANGARLLEEMEKFESACMGVEVAEKKEAKNMGRVVGDKGNQENAAAAAAAKQKKRKAGPRIAQLQDRLKARFGVSFDKILSQCVGNMYCALFFRNLDNEEKEPDQLPIEYAFYAALKDGNSVKKLLDQIAVAKSGEVLGGKYYLSTTNEGDEENAGLWIKDNQLIMCSTKSLIQYSVDALKNEADRFSARPDYKRLITDSVYSAKSLVMVYGRGKHLMRMPYGWAKLVFPEGFLDAGWPDYATVANQLNRLLIQVQSNPDGLTVEAESDLSLWLMYIIYTGIKENSKI